MYKRLIFVLILLVMCIGIGVGSFYAINKMSDELINELQKFEACSETNNNEAINTIDKCIEKLESYEKIYAVFLDHNQFESLLITIPSIKQLYVSGNTDEAMDKCLESIAQLKIVVHEQKLSFENVF